MYFVKAKTVLSSKNTINIFRGCSHSCIYCDSRSTCYQMKHHFEDIEVKENSISLLEDKLIRKRKKCMIHLGSMSDPYILEEKHLEYTKRVLELVYKYNFGVTLITKSDLILRDLDLIKKINDNTKCVVQMTLTTYDDNLCRRIERNVCPTSRRVKILKELNKLGVPTVVWLSPILPFINDTEDNIRGILHYCIEAKVYGVMCFGMGLTLRNGNREYFYKNLNIFFPNLKQKYIDLYGNNYMVNSQRHYTLMNIFHKICRDNNIVHDNKTIFNYLDMYEQKEANIQMSLFDVMENS